MLRQSAKVPALSLNIRRSALAFCCLSFNLTCYQHTIYKPDRQPQGTSKMLNLENSNLTNSKGTTKNAPLNPQSATSAPKNHFNKNIFREYDIRGIFGQDLTPELAYEIGLGIGTYVKRGGGKTIAVGKDCRLSGETLEQAFIKGLQQTGLAITTIGVVPTPVVYWAIEHYHLDAGVQITGSHNPGEYNGFKITAFKQSLAGKDIEHLYELISNQDYLLVSKEAAEKVMITKVDALPAYLQDLKRLLKPANRPLKIVVDAGNGVGGLTALPLYQSLGYTVIPLYCDTDGRFPHHHPDPTVEENLQDLKRAVAKEKADLGIAFDGDADRIGIVDRDGEVIWGDRLLTLLAREVLKEEPHATIIGEVKCSKTLFDDIQKHGGNPIMWRAGHSLIKKKMQETQALLAGEMSGHIFFKHRYYGFDDAVYAGGRLLEILSSKTDRRSITERLSDLPPTVATPEIRLDYADELKFKLVKQVAENFKELAKKDPSVLKIIDIDGVRVEWADGFGLVRASNTQPILVLRFEATKQARLQEIENIFRKQIDKVKQELN